MGRTGNRSPHAIFQQVVPCRGSDEWLAVSVLEEHQAAALLQVLGATAVAPLAENPDAADAALAGWSADRDAEHAAAELRAAGVPAARCQEPRKVAEQPQLVERGLFESIHHPVLGAHPTPGLPCRFASVERWLHRPAPTLGQHNAEALGLDPVEHDRLLEAGVIGHAPDRALTTPHSLHKEI